MFRIPQEEKPELERLLARGEANLRAMELFSRFMNHTPRAITGSEVEKLSGEFGLTREEAYRLLMAAHCGLNGEENPVDREMERRYFACGIHEANPVPCRMDPYYANVRLPKVKEGNWELGTKRIAAYECFPLDDPVCDASGREIPQGGFFAGDFDTPAVYQNGREWMTVTPSERNTMLRDVEAVSGRVAVFGLGLGYYPYLASLKPEVEEITVVELDQEVLSLFRRFLLPQFPNAGKIRLVQADAFDFAESMEGFDWAYVDIWHDVLDGTPMYVRMKRLEAARPETRFLYWIEPSMLCFLRSLILYEASEGEGPLLDFLGDISDVASFRARISDGWLKANASRISPEWVRR